MQKKTGVVESNNIRVVCRCRPLNKLEMEQGGEQCVKIIDDTNIQVTIAGEEHPHNFSFDKIFPSNTQQADVFREVGIMSGINATVFAYGQTSSGKTHTMEGKHDDPEYKGLIPRMMERLFEMITSAPSNLEFTIKASFLEIYNEKIHDLLDTSKTNLNVKEDKLRGIVVHEATEACVVKAADMMKVMQKGAENRSVAATRMNERSSRSHSIFLLTLLQKNTETETSKTSKLYFVDLAGSEKIAKTNVTGQQLEEAKNINKSLTCLGIVINALSEKKDHIPYRDSKLTRILQESIGGNSKTTLIIACSMCSYNDKETVGTLRFGQRAKSIKNTAKVNEERSAKELMLMLAKAESVIKYKDEVIAALNEQLNAEGVQPNISGIIHRAQLSSSSSEDKQNGNMIAEHSGNQGGETKDTVDTTVASTPVVVAEAPAKKTLLIPKQNNSAQTSRKILEQHLEIIKQKELIEKLTGEKQDLEIDLANRTTDLQSANDKCKSLAEALDKTYKETEQQFEKYYDQVDRLQSEAAQWGAYTRELKKYTSRLSSDLSFILMSEELDEIDVKFAESNGSEISADRQVSATIKKTLDALDALSSYLSRAEEVQSTHHATTEGSDPGLPDHQRKLKTAGDEEKPRKKREGSKLFASPRTKQSMMSLHGQGGMIRMQRASTCDYHEILSTDGCDDILLTDDSLPPLASVGNLNGEFILEEGREEDDDDDQEMLAAEEEDIKAIIELTQSLGIADDSAKEDLQTFMISMKRQIRNLTSQNQEFNLTIESMQSCSEGIGSKYKKRIGEVKRVLSTKIKEQEIKFTNLSQRYNEKLVENKNLTLKHEKELMDKNQSYMNLKVEFENLKKIIQSNHPISRIAELQAKIKELVGDRQKMFNELFAARRDLDDKDVLLKEKESIIAALKKQQATQANSKSLATGGSMPSDFNNIKTASTDIIVTSRAAVVERKSLPNENNINTQTKGKIISLKSHIAPSIRGGDGSIASFQKNNEYLLSEEFEQTNSKSAIQFSSNSLEGGDGSGIAPLASARESQTITTTAPQLNNSQLFQSGSKIKNTSTGSAQSTSFVATTPMLLNQLSARKQYKNQTEEEEEMAQEFTRIENSSTREAQKNFAIFGKSNKKAEAEKLQQQHHGANTSATSSIFGAMKKIFM